MKIVMSCGGTGGHIYPAIAIADKIREHHPEAEILFIGTKKGMENSLDPAESIWRRTSRLCTRSSRAPAK